jgi:hypothetical protein
MASAAPRVMAVTWARAARARSTLGFGKATAGGRRQQGLDHGQARRPRGRRPQPVEQDPGPRVAVRVEPVPEAAEPLAPAEPGPDHGGRPVRPVDLGQQGLDPQ